MHYEENLVKLRAVGEELGVEELDLKVLRGVLNGRMLPTHLEWDTSVSDILNKSFTWDESEQGWQYWKIIYDKLISMGL